MAVVAAKQHEIPIDAGARLLRRLGQREGRDLPADGRQRVSIAGRRLDTHICHTYGVSRQSAAAAAEYDVRAGDATLLRQRSHTDGQGLPLAHVDIKGPQVIVELGARVAAKHKHEVVLHAGGRVTAARLRHVATDAGRWGLRHHGAVARPHAAGTGARVQQFPRVGDCEWRTVCETSARGGKGWVSANTPKENAHTSLKRWLPHQPPNTTAEASPATVALTQECAMRGPISRSVSPMG